MKDLITFETARLAKEKGFDIKTKNWYDQLGGLNPYYGPRAAMCYKNVGYAPTQSELQKWLREKKGVQIVIIPTITSYWTFKTIEVISQKDNDVIHGIKSVSDLPPYNNVSGEDFSTYEQALEYGLLQALSELHV